MEGKELDRYEIGGRYWGEDCEWREENIATITFITTYFFTN